MRDRTEDILQEGVSYALATLHAIEAADLFRTAPADEHDAAAHNNGCWLLSMLHDQLTRIQTQADEAVDARVAARREGR